MTKSISLQKESSPQEGLAGNHPVRGAPGEGNRSPGGKKVRDISSSRKDLEKSRRYVKILGRKILLN
jgi:hypothetical protein